MMLAENETSPGAGGTEAQNEAGHFESPHIASGASTLPSNPAVTFVTKLQRYRTARAAFYAELDLVEEEFNRTGDVKSEEAVNRLYAPHAEALIDVLLCPAHTVDQFGSKIEIIAAEEIFNGFERVEEVVIALLADKRALIGGLG